MRIRMHILQRWERRRSAVAATAEIPDVSQRRPDAIAATSQRHRSDVAAPLQRHRSVVAAPSQRHRSDVAATCRESPHRSDVSGMHFLATIQICISSRCRYGRNIWRVNRTVQQIYGYNAEMASFTREAVETAPVSALHDLESLFVPLLYSMSRQLFTAATILRSVTLSACNGFDHKLNSLHCRIRRRAFSVPPLCACALTKGEGRGTRLDWTSKQLNFRKFPCTRTLCCPESGIS